MKHRINKRLAPNICYSHRLADTHLAASISIGMHLQPGGITERSKPPVLIALIVRVKGIKINAENIQVIRIKYAENKLYIYRKKFI